MKMISTIESIINNTINQTLLFQKSEFSLEEFDLLSQINKQKKIIEIGKSSSCKNMNICNDKSSKNILSLNIANCLTFIHVC